MSDFLRDRVAVAVGQHYLLQEELGRGAMSLVYGALDVRLNRRVAIKALPPEFAFNREVRERFQREAQMAAQLTHPNIVPIYDVGDHGGIAYFVMALIEGESLAARLAREPRPPTAEIRRILREVAGALAYAHARGVVHRDIKPDNILLEVATGRSIVTDFGIARAAEADSRLTATGIAMGTPAYMSPEQALGEREVDGRSDVYSLGAVGFQMLTGAPPFAATKTIALMMKHVGEPPPQVRIRRPDADPTLASAVDRALLKDPGARWPSAAAFRDAVDAVGIGGDVRRGAGVASLRAQRDETPATDGDRLAEWRSERRDRAVESRTPSLEERVVGFRRALAASAGTVGMLATINLLTSPHFLWFLFPTICISIGVTRRAGALWADGVRINEVFGQSARLAARAAMPSAPLAADPFLAAVPGDVLAGPHGPALRRAAEDRTAILDLLVKLPAADRELLPEIEPTVRGLADRVATIVPTLQRLDAEVPPAALADVERRLADARLLAPGEARERRTALLERQRATLHDLLTRREALAAQLESAGLALQTLRLDLLRLRSSGVGAAVQDLTSATQEARALSREIAHVLAAAAELKTL